MSARLRRLIPASTMVVALLLLAGCAGTKASVNTGDAQTNEGLNGFTNGFCAVIAGIARIFHAPYRPYYNPKNNYTYDVWWTIGLTIFVLIVGALLFGGSRYRGRRRPPIV